MAKKGTTAFNRSKVQHKRLFSKANYSNEKGSYAKFFYHATVLSDMDNKGRTLTKAEKRTIWKDASARGRDYE